MVKTTNLNASLNRIARDGQISAPEVNRVTAAVIRDLAQNGDALKIFEKIGENLGKFISKVKTEMGEPSPELRASEAALEKLEDITSLPKNKECKLNGLKIAARVVGNAALLVASSVETVLRYLIEPFLQEKVAIPAS